MSRIPYTFVRGLPGTTGNDLKFAKFLYHHMRFCRLGLMRDDCLMDTPEVIEAVHRLPSQLNDERMFRISRALNLSAKRIILPKEEWTKLEDDVKYLQPFIDEVRREKEEKEAWLRGEGHW